MKTRYRTTWIALAIVCTSACVFLFSVFYSEAKHTVIAKLSEEQVIHARQAARGIEEFFATWTSSLNSLAKMDEIVANDAVGRRYMKAFYEANQEQITSITRLDEKGEILHNFPLSNSTGTNIAGQKHVRELLRYHKPVISDVFRAVEGYDAVALHVPIFKGSVFQGSIGILINFESLAKRYLDVIKIGKTGYAWVISRDGTILFSAIPGFTGKSVFGTIKDSPSLTVVVDDMLKGHEGTAEYTYDRIGDRSVGPTTKYAVYMPIHIGGTFWSIAVASAEQDVLSGLISFRNKLAMVIGALFLCGMVFSTLGAKAWLIVKEEEKRKLAETKLQESERSADKFSTLFHATPFAMALATSPDGVLYDVNQAWLDLAGFPRKEAVVGQPRVELEVIRDAESRERILIAFRQHGSVRNREVATCTKAGVQRTLSVNLDWVDIGGRKFVLSAMQDITERKRAEEELARSSAETQRQKDLLAVTLASIGDGVIVTDAQGRVTFLNGEAERLTGWTSGEAEGHSLPAVFHIVNEQTRQPAENPVEKVFRLGTVVGLANHTILISKDGREIPIDDSGAPIRQGDGTVQGVVLVFRDFTEQKQAEKALRERERLLQDVIDGSTSPIFLKNRDGKFITINASLEKMLGMSREEIKGKTDYDIAPKEVADYWRTHDTRVMATGKAIQIEEVADLQDGRHVFLANKFPLVDADGQVYGVGAISHDITERKHAEEALRKSEQEFRTLTEAMPQIVWATRPDGWNIYFNQQWMDYTGLTLDESYGHGWNTPFHPDDKQRAWDAWQRATRHNEPYLLECRLRRADGVYRWWLIHGTPMRGANGEIQKWFGTCTDIEDRKQAEESLRESEERHQLATSVAKEAIWEVDLKTGTARWNRAYTELFGRPAEATAHGPWWLNRIHPDDRERVDASFATVLAEGGDSWTCDYRMKLADDSYAFLNDRAIIVRDKVGSPLRAVGAKLNVTERKRAEDALLEAKTAAEAATVAKSQFLANMSHELRTPMNAILGMIDVALPKAIDPTVQDCLKTAKGSADLLLTLLNDLLDSAKIESGKLELESAPFSLRRMLDQITRVLAVRASEKGLAFYCRLPDESLDAVVGDRMRLQQVLLNLASNAIKFTERGDVEIGLHALSQDGEACLEFAVRDTGIGIPPSGVERLFQPFAQADASMARRFGGTGLGLAISKSLVEMMGGRIWVESELGVGSTFYFTVRLPVAKELPADYEAPVMLPTAACAQLRILLVEDNPANQKLATYILQDRGHLVEIAGDGQEAVYLTERNGYDVILMDVQMPGMNGLEATAAIRRHENGGSRVPIIAMTAHAMRGDREHCLAAGMDGYLSKPINAQEMLGLVESLARGAVPVPQPATAPPGPAETSPQATAVVFNPDEALSRCFNSPDMVREMIQCLVDEVDNSFPKMRAALEKGDLEEVGRLGHRMKGTVVYLGAEPAKRAALAVERFCKSSGGTAAEAEEAINALKHECIVLKAALTGHPLAAEPKQGD